MIQSIKSFRKYEHNFIHRFWFLVMDTELISIDSFVNSVSLFVPL